MSLQMHGKTDPLEGSIVGDQAHISRLKILQQLFRERFTRCKVRTPGLAKTVPFIGCPGDQQDLTAGICGLAVQAAFSDVHLAVGLNIDQRFFQISHLYSM